MRDRSRLTSWAELVRDVRVVVRDRELFAFTAIPSAAVWTHPDSLVHPLCGGHSSNFQFGELWAVLLGIFSSGRWRTPAHLLWRRASGLSKFKCSALANSTKQFSEMIVLCEAPSSGGHEFQLLFLPAHTGDFHPLPSTDLVGVGLVRTHRALLLPHEPLAHFTDDRTEAQRGSPLPHVTQRAGGGMGLEPGSPREAFCWQAAGGGDVGGRSADFLTPSGEWDGDALLPLKLCSRPGDDSRPCLSSDLPRGGCAAPRLLRAGSGEVGWGTPRPWLLRAPEDTML